MYYVQYSSKRMQCNACSKRSNIYCIADIAACSTLFFEPQTLQTGMQAQIQLMNVMHTFQVHLLLHYKSWKVCGSLKTATSFATQKSYS